MKKIKGFFLKLLYGLPYGLKAADTEIMGGGQTNGNDISVGQEVSDERVAKHLLKGELTQEVEELRYRTHLVEKESKNFKYIGNGVAIKEENEKLRQKTKFKFSQDNENLCESVKDAFNQIGKYGIEQYRFEIGYKDFVRFKIDKFATRIDVNVDEENDLIETTLHFSTERNPYDAASQPFINELEKLVNATSQHEIERSEIASSIQSISFTTFKASNEDDMVTYSFSNLDGYKGIKKENYEYLITFAWGEYTRLPLNLEVKYYSKSMADKYAKKERKNIQPTLVENERKRYCSVCGREMSVYDADMQEADGGEPICKECMQKALNNK